MKKKGNSHKKSHIQKVKAHYLKLYKDYACVWCPALKSEVHFTNMGWDHLFEEKSRTSKEAERRLKLLPLAKKLIGLSTTIYRKRFQNSHDHYDFKALIDGVNLSVLVKEHKKKYYFYSVFCE